MFAHTDDGLLENIHPLALLTTYVTSFVAGNNHDSDTMTLQQAMQQPDCERIYKGNGERNC
jgi:hypothetical protein